MKLATTSAYGVLTLGYAIQAMCPEGAPQSGAPYRIEIIRASPLLAPLSGRIFAWRVPRVETGLKPWAKPFCPFGAQTLYPSLKLNAHAGGRQTEQESYPPNQGFRAYPLV